MYIYIERLLNFWHFPHPADRHASHPVDSPRLVSPIPIVLLPGHHQEGQVFLQVFPAGLGLAGLILCVLTIKTENKRHAFAVRLPRLRACRPLSASEFPLRPFLRPQTSSLSYPSLLSLRGAPRRPELVPTPCCWHRLGVYIFVSNARSRSPSF